MHHHRRIKGTMLLALAGVFLLALLASGVEPPAGEGLEQLGKTIGAVVKAADLKGARVGIHVMDAETGETVYALNDKEALNPASGIKVATALAALVYLGPEATFTTTLLADPPVKGKVKKVYLRGSGDPSLRTSDLRDLADGLAARGVTAVTAGIVVDGSRFDDEVLPYGFDHHPKSDAESAFRAPVGGVTINAGTLQIRVLPGAGPGAHAAVSVFPRGYVDLDNATETLSDAKTAIKVSTWAEGDRMKVKIWGTVSTTYKGGLFSRRAEDPLALAGYGLAQVLEERGIAVGGKVEKGHVPGSAVRVAAATSEPLSSLLLDVGKASRNVVAEQLLKAIGAEVKGAPGSGTKGAEAVMELLGKAGIDTAAVTYRNGSGLYDANAVSASAVAKLLRYAYGSPEIAPEFLSQLAVGGVDGTLAGRLGTPEALRHVRAKTGTQKGMTSLSGYVLAPPGKTTLCFSIIVNDAQGRIAYFRSLQDRIVGEMASWLYPK